MRAIVLEIAFTWNGEIQTIFPVLLKNETAAILVDCGYPGFAPKIDEALHLHGLALTDLTGLVLTHHDIDHMGAASELKQQCPSMVIYAPTGEASWINGEAKALRLQQAEDLYSSLPEEYKPAPLQFQQMLKTVVPVGIDVLLNDADLLPGGVQVIGTPGHTPGHISLFLPAERTLLAADALIAENGELEIANPQYALNLQNAVRSIEKLKTLGIEKLICYHGGVVEGDITKKLDTLLSKYSHVFVGNAAV